MGFLARCCPSIINTNSSHQIEVVFQFLLIAFFWSVTLEKDYDYSKALVFANSLDLCTCLSLSRGISLFQGMSANTSTLSDLVILEGCIATNWGSSLTLSDLHLLLQTGSWASLATFLTLEKEQEKVRLNKISSFWSTFISSSLPEMHSLESLEIFHLSLNYEGHG